MFLAGDEAKRRRIVRRTLDRLTGLAGVNYFFRPAVLIVAGQLLLDGRLPC